MGVDISNMACYNQLIKIEKMELVLRYTVLCYAHITVLIRCEKYEGCKRFSVKVPAKKNTERRVHYLMNTSFSCGAAISARMQ